MASCCKKIVRYIAASERMDERFNEGGCRFSEAIQRLVDEGWQPFGGVSVGYKGEMVQALVKYEGD